MRLERAAARRAALPPGAERAEPGCRRTPRCYPLRKLTALPGLLGGPAMAGRGRPGAGLSSNSLISFVSRPGSRRRAAAVRGSPRLAASRHPSLPINARIAAELGVFVTSRAKPARPL